MLTFVTEGEGPSPSSRKTSHSLSTTPVPPPSSKTRAPLLVQLAEVCLEQQLPGLASECLAAFPREVRRQMLTNLKRHSHSVVCCIKSDDHQLVTLLECSFHRLTKLIG